LIQQHSTNIAYQNAGIDDAEVIEQSGYAIEYFLIEKVSVVTTTLNLDRWRIVGVRDDQLDGVHHRRTEAISGHNYAHHKAFVIGEPPAEM
jgi:hypothetical protein